MPSRTVAPIEWVSELLRAAARGSVRACVALAPATIALADFRALGDEVQRLVRVDARRALRVARVMAQVQSRVHDPRAAALASRAQAESLLFLGRYAEALDTYRETVRLYAETGDDLESARVSVGEIPTLMYLSRFDEAMALGRRTEIVLRRHRERTYLGRLYMNLGNLCFTMDRYAEARRYYTQARRELTAVGGRDAVVVGLEINEGVVATNLDAMDQAERLLLGAVARAGEMGWRSLAAQGEFDLGTVYALQSRYQDALAAVSRASRVFDAEDKSLAAIAEQTRAEIYLRLNMTDEATSAASAALAHFEHAGMRYDAALARTLLGVALKRAGALDEARTQLDAARAFLAGEGNHVRVAALDVHLARLDAETGDFAAAQDRARAAEETLRARGLLSRATQARVLRSELALDAGDARGARELLQSVRRLPDRVAQFERAFLLGRVHEAEGAPRQARAAYARATALAETLRVSMAGDEHKMALTAFRAEATARSLALLLDGDAPGARTTAAAFALIEGARARALGDMLGDAATPRRRRDRALDAATRKLAWFTARLEREELEAAPAPARLASLRTQVATHEREVTALHRRAREEAPAATRAAGRTHTLADVQRSLDDGEVLVEYFAVRERLYAVRADRRRRTLVELPCTVHEAERLASRLAFQVDTVRYAGAALSTLASRLTGSARAPLADAHAALIAPLVAAAGALPDDGRLIVIPHGPLHRLPFGAFEHDGHALWETQRITAAPSASAFVDLRARRASRRHATLIGGAADHNAPQIAAELDAVALAWASAKPRTAHGWSADDFLRDAPEARLLHLATHGRFRDDNPLFSALKFADRWVSLYEILGLTLDAELVVLSGCDTGAGRHYAGDDVFGLAGGFLTRGARRLLVSLWPVDDPAAATLAGDLHRHLAGGIEVDDALRQAALALREAQPHPYYWAPFTLVGASGAVA